jgi:hypothetical protein
MATDLALPLSSTCSRMESVDPEERDRASSSSGGEPKQPIHGCNRVCICFSALRWGIPSNETLLVSINSHCVYKLIAQFCKNLSLSHRIQLAYLLRSGISSSLPLYHSWALQ